MRLISPSRDPPSDIVWLVEQTVTLADGSTTTTTLVPQIYARVREGDLDGTGTLLAGRELNINLTGDMTNTGMVAGRTIVSLTAENVQNLGGRISGMTVSGVKRRNGRRDAEHGLLAAVIDKGVPDARWARGAQMVEPG